MEQYIQLLIAHLKQPKQYNNENRGFSGYAAYYQHEVLWRKNGGIDLLPVKIKQKLWQLDLEHFDPYPQAIGVLEYYLAVLRNVEGAD